MNTILKTIPDKKGRYIVLDTETTGLDPNNNDLIGISAVEILDGKITGSQFNAYVKSREYENFNENISKNKFYYVEEYSKELFEIEKHTLSNFLNFVGDSLIFAHNAIFDCRFINKELINWGLPIIPFERYRCTLIISKTLIKSKNNKFTLKNLCSYFKFNFNKKDFHHGLFDAFMCARIVCKLFDLNFKENIKIEKNKNVLKNNIINENLNPNLISNDTKYYNKFLGTHYLDDFTTIENENKEHSEKYENINKINHDLIHKNKNNLTKSINFEIEDIFKDFNELNIHKSNYENKNNNFKHCNIIGGIKENLDFYEYMKSKNNNNFNNFKDFQSNFKENKKDVNFKKEPTGNIKSIMKDMLNNKKIIFEGDYI